MSYVFNSPCSTCSKKDTCLDGLIIGAGINTVYQTGQAHQGSGRVDHVCDNHVELPMADPHHEGEDSAEPSGD